MICHRCGALIEEGKAEEVAVETGSGAAATIYIRRNPCKSDAARQTAPKRRRH